MFRAVSFHPHVLAVGVVVAAAFAAPAAAATGDWAAGAKAQLRLLGVAADGWLDGAIEIVMPPGWKTYWRNPGTAGIAPEFDFAASRNFGTPEIGFPLPKRLDDGYSITNVYEGRVVLPFRAAIPDPAKPAEIAVTIRLGVCDVVCIPDEVSAHLTVPPGEDDAAVAATLAGARAKLPGPPEPGVFAVDAIARQGGTDGKPVFRIAATVPAGGEPVAYVEGPDDWAAYAPVLAGREGERAFFDVKFSRLGATTPIPGAAIRVTIAAGGRAIEQTIGLD